jgi:glutaconyl-CoA/methylmalonyl-CoA decarboxylase subunit gamma
MKIHVRIQDKTYQVQIGDIHARPIPVKVDGDTFEVWPEEMIVPTDAQNISAPAQVSHPIKPANISTPAAQKASSSDVTAPIPGAITAISVNAGDRVSYGQELCVLEAMKMKNSIRAGRDGVIAKIHITVGQQVQQGFVLMEYEGEAT